MSQYPTYPGPGYPIDYNAGAFVPNPRPTSVTVIAIFAIIVGSLFLLCNGAGFVVQLMMLLTGGGNPFLPGTVGGPAAAVKPDSAITVYNVISAAINILVCASLLAIGIGGLKLRPLARRAMISLSVFIICWATLLTIVQIAWVGPRTLDYSHRLQAQMPGPKPPAMMANVEQGFALIGALIGWVLWCVLPVCALIFWRKPRVVAAFEGEPPPPVSGLPPGAVWPPPPGPPQF